MTDVRRGTVNIDIRDLVPDWTAFEAPKAPAGAPNVVCIHPVAHHGAVLADPLVPADWAQPHPQLDGLHHRGRGGLPELQRHDPAGKRHGVGNPG